MGREGRRGGGEEEGEELEKKQFNVWRERERESKAKAKASGGGWRFLKRGRNLK